MIDHQTLGLVVDMTSLLLGAGYIAYRFRDRRIMIDHRILFTMGHAYYLALPLVMARLRILDGQYSFVWAIFGRVPSDRALAFSTWTLALLIAFHAGSAMAESWTHRPVRVPLTDSASSTFPVSLAAIAGAYGIFLFVVVINLTIILSGYRSNDPTLIQSQTGRGTLAAAASLVGVMLLYSRSRLRDVAWPVAASSRSAMVRSLVFGAAFIPVMGTLLLAGGRLYATTFAVAAVVWLGLAIRPLRRTTIVVGGLAAFMLLTAYGSLRTGGTPSAADMKLFSTTEAVQGSIALFNTLEDNSSQFDAIRTPVLLASDSVNLVPRVLVPSKDDLRITPEDIGFQLDNPLGGLNVSVSLLVNFGSIGSLAVIFLLGWSLSRLRRLSSAPRSSVLRVTYSIIAGTLIMVFFRDPFSISVVRWWLLTAMIMPAALTAAMRLLARPTPR